MGSSWKAKGLCHAQKAQGVHKQLWLEENAAAAGRRGHGRRLVAVVCRHGGWERWRRGGEVGEMLWTERRWLWLEEAVLLS